MLIMKKIGVYEYIFCSILFLFIFTKTGLAQDAPTVELISYEMFSCYDKNNPETVNINFEVILNGTRPFSVRFTLDDVEHGYNFGTFILINNSYEEGNYVDSWSFSQNFLNNGLDTKSVTFKILEFKDGKTSEQDPWIRTGISGNIITNIYEVPKPTCLNDKVLSCDNSVTLSVTPGNENNEFYWSIEGDTGILTPDNETVTTFTAPPSDDFYQITFRETNFECFTEIPIEVKIFNPPKGEISTDSEVCGEGNAILKFSFEENSNLPIIVIYSDGTNAYEAEIKSLFNNSASVPHYVSGTKEFNIIEIIDANICYAKKEDITGTAKVIDNKPFVYAGTNAEICGNTIKLEANIPLEGESGKWTSTAGSFFKNGNEASNQYDANFQTENEYGTFNLTWTISVDGKDCSSSDNVEVTLWRLPESTVGKDSTIYSNEIILSANEPVSGTGVWIIVSGNCKIENINQHNSRATDFTIGDTKLEWFVTNYNFHIDLLRDLGPDLREWLVDNSVCYDSEIVTVTFSSMRYPTAFSPNGDNINDTFIILGAAQVKNNMLIVFDKNGKVVFKKANYGHDGEFWDGTNNGKDVPDGIYNYVFSGDDIKTVKKFLIIKRE